MAHQPVVQLPVLALFRSGQCGARRLTGRGGQDRVFLEDDADFAVRLRCGQQMRIGPFAPAAIVVEEFDDGGIALPVAADRVGCIAQQGVAAFLDRFLRCGLLGGLVAPTHFLQRFDDHLRVPDQVVPDDLADFLLLIFVEPGVGLRRCGGKAHGQGDCYRQRNQAFDHCVPLNSVWLAVGSPERSARLPAARSSAETG